MIFSAKYLYLIIIAIAILFFLKKNKEIKTKLFFFSLINLPIIFIISKIAGLLYYSPRPFVAKHFAPLISHAANNSFPSEHSLISFAVSSIVFVFNPKVGIFLFALSFIVGFSRVYVGVHYPIDILGSFIIAAATTSIVKSVLK